MNGTHSLLMKDNVVDFNESRLKSTPVAMVAPEMKCDLDDTEITKTCAVLGCDDSKSMPPDSFYRFPEDPEYRQLWTNLTGRSNWTPTDYSYICIQHFSVDCFVNNANDEMVLVDKAVPSLKLPRHVLEVEYIDEETLDSEYEELETEFEDSDTGNHVNGPHIKHNSPHLKISEEENIELLKLFTEVQKKQREVVGLKEKLKVLLKKHNRQNRHLERTREAIDLKRKVINQKRKKKAMMLLSIQERVEEDDSGLILAMPTRHTSDLKNFALSIYKYSPQSYIYIRNTLRTLLPGTETLDSWISSGYKPKNVLTSNNMVKVVAEQTETDLSCKISLG